MFKLLRVREIHSPEETAKREILIAGTQRAHFLSGNSS